MRRHQNIDWTLPEGTVTWEQTQTAVLMDIREELQRLNALLRCRNFQEIPMTLRSLARNTARKNGRPKAKR